MFRVLGFENQMENELETTASGLGIGFPGAPQVP